jgi:cyclic nucleotide gated channel
VETFYYLSLIFSKMSVQIFGASWYLFSIQRQHKCWSIECINEMNATHSPSCDPLFLDCNSLDKPERRAWLNVTKVLTSCDARKDYSFQFGMFADAFTNDVASSIFIEKYFYCLWWGLKNLRYALLVPTCSITG